MNLRKINQQGFTLLEILMALSLFSLTVYTIYSSTFTTTQSIRATRIYQQAVLFSENMLQYLQSHHNNPSGYEAAWQNQIHLAIPQANAYLVTSSTQTTIKIIWGGITNQQCQQSIAGLKGCYIITRTIIG